jgi:hypothetical protein
MITTYVLLGIIFIVVGFVGGALVTMLWTEKEKRSAIDKKQKDVDHSNNSVYLHQKGEQLELWLEGKPQREARSFNPAQRQVAMKLFNLYKQWLDIEDEPAVVEIKVPSTSNQILPVSQKILPPIILQTVKPADTSAEIALAAAVKQPEAASVPTKPALSMVEQIDKILQEKLVQNSMSDRGIRLEDDLLHGVVVWVGLKKFIGLDDLPDARIKEVIRSAVSEWEQRNTTSK